MDIGPPTVCFQPIVDLSEDACPVVAFEALARWPALPGLRIDALFESARGAELDELDWTCRLSTLQALDRMPSSIVPTVFLNVEPTSSAAPPDVLGALGGADQWDAAAASPIVLEITERHADAQPAAFLRLVAEARDRGWQIALDDVGAQESSIDLIDLVQPDIVKLDMAMIRPHTGRAQARTLKARILKDVLAGCQRTGATILAEGIETQRSLDRARSIGAQLGQGWRFGRAGPPRAADRPFASPRRGTPTAWSSPFGLLSDRTATRTAGRPEVTSQTLEIEQHALEMSDAPIVLAAFQTADGITEAVRARYTAIAARSPFTAMLGADMPAQPVPGAVGLSLAADDPLTDEWTVVVLNKQYSAALIARQLGGPGPRSEQQFRYAVTHDRALVTSAARSLLERVVPARRADRV